jgi:hypothetical protein
MRRDHTDTVWITESESTPVAEPESVNLQWVSPDADKILFSTSSKLLDEDENGGTDLYLYADSPNPEVDSNLVLVSDESGFGGVIYGASDDASRIYYPGGGESLILWEEGESRPAVFPVVRTCSWLLRAGGGPRRMAATLHFTIRWASAIWASRGRMSAAPRRCTYTTP